MRCIQHAVCSRWVSVRVKWVVVSLHIRAHSFLPWWEKPCKCKILPAGTTHKHTHTPSEATFNFIFFVQPGHRSCWCIGPGTHLLVAAPKRPALSYLLTHSLQHTLAPLQFRSNLRQYALQYAPLHAVLVLDVKRRLQLVELPLPGAM